MDVSLYGSPSPTKSFHVIQVDLDITMQLWLVLISYLNQGYPRTCMAFIYSQKVKEPRAGVNVIIMSAIHVLTV